MYKQWIDLLFPKSKIDRPNSITATEVAVIKKIDPVYGVAKRYGGWVITELGYTMEESPLFSDEEEAISRASFLNNRHNYGRAYRRQRYRR